ncbi:MAG: FAD:protein FMN transferase [Clostridia bacterium]|nr:FAD:protein FMN transferase [Clostridia bacterium]
MKYAKIFFVLIILSVCIASFTACSSTRYYTVFNTNLTVDIKSSSTPKQDADKIYEYMNDLESILSPTVENSDLWRINSAEVGVPVSCHTETMEIMRIAEYVFDKSNGAYDPSVYPLVLLWQFGGGQFKAVGSDFTPPSSSDISDKLSLVGLNRAFNADYDNNTITKLIQGAKLDFGGIAKGYAGDFATDTVSAKKLLVNLGGNISVKGKNYTIGVANPTRREDRSFGTAYFGTLTLGDGECISTSGDYERYYVVNTESGKEFYHHIIDPKTGRPANTSGEGGIVSATVVSTNGAFADAVATAVVVLGKEKGLDLLNRLSQEGRYPVSAVLIDGEFGYTTFNLDDFKPER